MTSCMTWKCSIQHSHLSYYLQNNQAPTEEDEKTVLSLKKTLDVEISLIQQGSNGTLDGTNVTDDPQYLLALLSSFSRCQIILSPSRRLPKEIWGEIFVRCLSTDRYPMLSHREAPLLLTHVAASWRDIALSTPDLWTQIEINSFKRQPQQHLVEQWLQHSGSLPLKINISSLFSPGYLQELLERIFSFSTQLQWLNLGLVDHLSRIPPFDRLQSLETLFVRMATMNDISNSSSIIHAPNVRDLTIHYLPHDLNIIPNTWSKLSKLAINCVIDRITARKLLVHCECLVHCNLMVVLNPTDNAPIIFHPRLKYLNITNTEAYGDGPFLTVDALFQELYPPNLRHFEWSIDHRCVPTPGAIRLRRLAGVTTQSPAHTDIPNHLPQLHLLETLGIKADTPQTQNTMISFLQQVPSSVKTLILHEMPFSRNTPSYDFVLKLLRLLSVPQQFMNSPSNAGPKFLVPFLENIDLTYYSSGLSDIHEFISARTSLDPTQGPFCRLKKFVAFINTDYHGGELGMDELDSISNAVDNHVRRLGIPFRLEIHSGKNQQQKKLLKKMVFDPPSFS